MSQLNQQTCEACNASAAKVSDSELTELMQQLPQWSPVVRNGVMQLERQFKFKNFKLALEFTNQVAEIAEAEFHHPTLVTEWGKVTVTWWTHAINGLHRNDFIMAARTDALLSA